MLMFYKRKFTLKINPLLKLLDLHVCHLEGTLVFILKFVFVI